MIMQVKSIEEHVRASAEYKLGVANQSITAGFFDDNTRLGHTSTLVCYGFGRIIPILSCGLVLRRLSNSNDEFCRE